ncbi:MAG: TIGR04282 family arsenosugar biosynthesis glycosyltransferase [Blastocatellia bacterium]
MAKVPEPGVVKTRLRPFLTDDQCAELSVCFLKDAVAKALRVTKRVIVAYSAVGDGAEIFDLLPESIMCLKQTGKDLGERIAAAIDFAESECCGPIVVIGTDSPTLPDEVLVTSFERLQESSTEIVLGGTEDGGYYLVGLKSRKPAIFQEIPWSSDGVYSATLHQAEKIGMTEIVELTKLYDVDTPTDLWRLFTELNGDIRSRAISPATSRWVDANRNLFDQPSHRHHDVSGDILETAGMD